MELEELKNLWSDCHKKLDRNLKLNRTILKEINLSKMKSKMRRMMTFRAAEALCFLMIIIGLWGFIAANLSLSAPIISAFILTIFGTIGLAGSIGQIILIGAIDYSNSVILIQKQLGRIKSHGIQALKLIMLSIPFYMSYIFLGSKLLFKIDLSASADRNWLILNIIISLCLIIPTLWLYRELGTKATTHNWVKRLISDSGGKEITTAVEFLGEIETFENEDD
jgi:hypothetical protein